MFVISSSNYEKPGSPFLFNMFIFMINLPVATALLHSDAFLILLCLQHSVLGCCPPAPSVNTILTPTLPSTLSWWSVPSSRVPFLPCLGSESPHQAALPSPFLQVHHHHPVGSLIPAASHTHAWMSSLHSGSDTLHCATFIHRCSLRPVQVLTSCSGLLR